MLNVSIDSLKNDRLVWLPEIGVGYYPVKDQPYDAQYFERYRAMDHNPVANALNASRIGLVNSWFKEGLLVDIGVGGGRFVEEADCTGYDINPVAVEWLKDTGRWHDPYKNGCDYATFWDSLEHIHDPSPLLNQVKHMVFVSMPIYQHANHILRSKHFRKDEHCWYFTRRGLKWFMAQYGFKCVEWNTMEQPLREDIESFAFVRS